uniref:Uncharacterized protein n=1 Tax=Rhipicephalus zambeziensis TaxID=60191 RepID=A0A224Y8X4_9ACAR
MARRNKNLYVFVLLETSPWAAPSVTLVSASYPSARDSGCAVGDVVHPVTAVPPSSRAAVQLTTYTWVGHGSYELPNSRQLSKNSADSRTVREVVFARPMLLSGKSTYPGGQAQAALAYRGSGRFPSRPKSRTKMQAPMAGGCS